jgi:DNA processing protein
MNKNTNLDLNYLLILLHFPISGSTFGKLLLNNFPNFAAFYHTDAKTLQNLGFATDLINKIKYPDFTIIAQDLAWVEQPGNTIINIFDEHYPQLLREIPNPPLALFIKGNVKVLTTDQIAIVGSRNPSYTGKANAKYFANELATIGLTITSGLAKGIDATSHISAVNINKPTIAVLGSGLDTIYPSNNIQLATKIIETNGALVSEFPIGTKVKPLHFPLRNRIISGLSLGTLVIEATIRSGSLITARYATEQGREVFAIPGSIHNPLARGCHMLLRQGAKLVETIDDIVEELKPSNIFYNNSIVTTATSITAKLDNKHTKLLECIGYELTTMDEIIERSSFSVKEISIMLLELELQNCIQSITGSYIRIK